ncbi:MAG: 4-hydroxyphenylacetate 3-hydroxylase [Peptococcaceae bacterium]|nr:4-hydroxyphenylacetate 3-hydroxylase [Peptococcaceae bacterium]
MALKTREEYLQSLKAMRPNIFKYGERIDDVTSHWATRRVVESHARGIEAAHNPEYADIFTTASNLTGEKIHRHNSLMTCMEDVINNARMKRVMYHLTGTCTGGLCAGWNAFNVMWAVTWEIDRKAGTDYQSRLKSWILRAQNNGLVVAGALTDAKGNRSLKASQQEDPDVHVRVVEAREDGIVVRGAKHMIAGTAASNEIFVIPGTAYGPGEESFAVSFAVPRDTEGLTIVEARHPSDEREQLDDFDAPVTGITQGFLYFDNVFIPRERVFLCGEVEFTRKIIQFFTANYRACIGACVAGQGDVMIGAAALMARSNGLSARTFSDKIVQMAVNNETTFGLGIGAIAMGFLHPAGVWVSDSLLAHTNKVHVATLPYETKRLCQEIGGGIVETGCFPSARDFNSPKYGELVRRYMKAGPVSAETRARAARLSEWLTIGAGVPGCMHGGGSPDGARLVVRSLTPVDRFADLARALAGIDEPVNEPEKKK